MKRTRKTPANQWAPHEQLILFDAITKAQANGQTIGYAFKQAAADVNRTASAAGWQWYSVLVKKIKSGEFKPEKVRAELAKKGSTPAAPQAPVMEVPQKRKYTRRVVETANHVSVAGQTTRKPQAEPSLDFESMSYREIITTASKNYKRLQVLELELPKAKAALQNALNVIEHLQEA
jgi:hypothetical protein